MTIDYQPLTERIDIDIETFRNEIMPSGQPVVLRGIVKDWRVTQAAKRGAADLASLLEAAAGSATIEVMSGEADIQGRFFYDEAMTGFNFRQDKMMFKDFIREVMNIEDGASLYMGSHPLADVMPSLSKDCPMRLVPEGTPPRIWIGTNSVVSTHYDMSFNVACVLSGTRRFTLFPPSQIANLYPGPIENNMAGPQVSLPNPEAPDLNKFPRFKDALQHGRQAELLPGDAIYIPALWWHHVRAIGTLNVLMNYWWSPVPQYSRAPLEALVLSLLAVRQLPAAEREAWKNLFDYFIFQTDGPPMEHLPDHVSGVLGPHSPERASQIWEFFKGLLR